MVAALLWLLVAPAPAEASPASDEATFVTMINGFRTSNGLPALVVDSQLTGLARQWSANMAARDTLDHAADLSVGVSTDWDLLGENVGVHSVHDLEALFQAFVASPGHRANLLDSRFDYVGVGVVHSGDGKIWTTHRFRSVPGSLAPPPPTPTSPPPPVVTTPPAPAPTTTTRPVATRPTTTRAPARPAPTPAPTSAPTPAPSSAPAAGPLADRPLPVVTAGTTPPAVADLPAGDRLRPEGLADRTLAPAVALHAGSTSTRTDAGLPRRGSAAAEPFLTYVVAMLTEAAI